jgi:ABC-type bacteriocin/lantibiotic exporter with double-glycine peptidase domain
VADVILPVPHYYQEQGADCLAACSAMALSYIGHSVSYPQLLKILNIQWFGAPFSNVKLLEQLGIRVIFQQGTLESLYNHLSDNSPPIVPVFTGELPYTSESTNHAVVVVGMTDNYIYVNDPAVRTDFIPLPHGDFELAWLERGEYYAVLLP